MAMADVDGNSLQAFSQPKSVSLVWRLVATFCIHHMNWVISHNSYGHYNSTIYTGNGISIITIINRTHNNLQFLTEADE